MRTALLIPAALLVATAARAERPPLPSDLDRCSRAAAGTSFGANLQGRLRMELLVRPDGKVFASFINNQSVDHLPFERCVVNQSLLWEFPAAGVGYRLSYPLIIVLDNETQSSIFRPDLKDTIAAEPMDVKLAQTTLEIADWASAEDQAVALLAVRKTSEAVNQFRGVLKTNPGSVVALNGLARALAMQSRAQPAAPPSAQPGAQPAALPAALDEARAVAQKLSALAPKNPLSHEAMLTVCLERSDRASDECSLREFTELRAQANALGPRVRNVRDELQPRMEGVFGRLRGAHAQENAGGATLTVGKDGDDCQGRSSLQDAAACEVQRCLGVGAEDYVRELGAQNGVAYAPGRWTAVTPRSNKVVVARSIRPDDDHAPISARHDAYWLVTLDKQTDRLSIVPSNFEARQITLGHNACRR